ncbi:thiol-disulfide oxidoreductase DCC family protein [Demequina iriomotensis]|uniref:thiol-disulfide oxidoreductase DCC family protein n=1 Tax=Demequina iriomotensis TaxID=1536641 RepID=UPI0007844AD5|nr:DCC1-like thiol-disulfide oxidoreductase family protein [Demequina iriomotensis]
MHTIVVFDGECGLCNGFVAWLLPHDRDGAFRIAGSAGEVGRAVLDVAGLDHDLAGSTIVVWDGRRALMRTDALVAIARGLPWPWRAAAVMRIVPRPWRDSAYRAMARRRARQHADDPACGVPPAHLRELWRTRLATLEDVAVRAT